MMTRSKPSFRASAIVLDGNRVLLMHRFFEGREYYVIPGGGREAGETTEQAAVRELKEETTLDITLGHKLGEFTNEKDGRVHTIYLAEGFKGTVTLGGEEAAKHSTSNWYRPEWYDLHSIATLPIVPEAAKRILQELASSKKRN